MFRTIMTPVDLTQLDGLEKALKISAEIAKQYGAEVHFVGVTSNAPGALGHNPEEFAEKLDAFAGDQAEKHGITVRSEPVVSNDPATDLDDTLLDAVDRSGADLVVMQSHMPSAVDHVWPSNGGKVAEHARCSVMVVRD